MKKKDFERLKASIIESGQTLRGERPPARQTVYEVTERRTPVKTYAVCVETDDPDLLIPRKLYEVMVVDGKYARVIDEAGEAAVYPFDYFLPISLTKKAERVLAQIA